MNIAKRVGALEGQSGAIGFGKVHQIICTEGQTVDQAQDAYGRDKIGPRDFVIIRTFVSPRFDNAGNMISFKDWPENRAAASISASSV